MRDDWSIETFDIVFGRALATELANWYDKKDIFLNLTHSSLRRSENDVVFASKML